MQDHHRSSLESLVPPAPRPDRISTKSSALLKTPTKKDKVDDLDTLEGEAGPVPKQPKPKKQRNVVLSLEYPRLCPLSQEGAASEEKVTVRVLKMHGQQLWVSERNIPWLIQYMATEHALGSVDEAPRSRW